MSQIEVKVLADSVSESGARLTTFELYYHRYFHSEFMTHRMLSKNAASSRAIPSDKLLEVVETSPMVPVSVGANQPGMQASNEVDATIADEFIKQWKELNMQVAVGVKSLHALGAHKQIVNRPLEAWLPIRVVVTGTDWTNFFDLRDSIYAQPEFAELAKQMRSAMQESTPVELQDGQWHLPYVSEEDRQYVRSIADGGVYWKTLCALSAARCGRVSHAIGGLSTKSITDEIDKGRELFKLKHMSPFEHVATPWNVTVEAWAACPDTDDALDALTHWLNTPNSVCPEWADVRNLRGWRQFRSFVEHQSMEL